MLFRSGLPEGVLSRAKACLRELEAGNSLLSAAEHAPVETDQLSLAQLGADEVSQILRDTDLNTLTPIEAMNLLFELQRKARG